ncbi:sensor histidine kinase [Oxalobacteraceae bacterium OM1]|nr:sensor histidine kinase [Oxalobacteraceae bacterium OM1]
MRPELIATIKRNAAVILHQLREAFERLMSWVSQLSWWKFVLFAILVIIAGSLLDDALFASKSKVVVVKNKNSHGEPRSTIVKDDEADIRIDSSGIHIRKKAPQQPPQQPKDEDEDGDTTETPAAPDLDSKVAPAAPAAPASPATPAGPRTPPPPPMPPKRSAEVHIDLPPDIGQEVRDAINEAVQDAAEEKAAVYKKSSSTWFMNFVLLLVLFLFGTRVLIGGKKRAEARATEANATAEREALQRQVAEAKVQMMQAQVEPHFLFNTLGSVEYLIETDPPRAAAMQRTLIQYLRAVLPQMRETPSTTKLGREADMVRAYLDLLKMRMEERLNVDFNIPEGLRSASFPPMMLQSLVENSIKHGLEPKAEGGTMRVFAEVAHNKLRVTVADNGLGFGAVESNGTGLGLQNIRERLSLLFGNQAQLIIVPNSPSGVCATIEVPYQVAT